MRKFEKSEGEKCAFSGLRVGVWGSAGGREILGLFWASPVGSSFRKSLLKLGLCSFLALGNWVCFAFFG